jgi:hypothetical protein
VFINKAYSTESNTVSAYLSYNSFDFGYKYHLKRLPLKFGGKIGIANQDINSAFNDYKLTALVDYEFVKIGKSKIYLEGNIGYYIANNDLYSENTLFYRIGVGCHYRLGKSDRHGLYGEVYYCYGNREFIDQYQNEGFAVKTIETLELSPVQFSIGYSYSF